MGQTMNYASVARTFRSLPAPVRYGVPGLAAAMILLRGGRVAAASDAVPDAEAVAGPAFPWLVSRWTPAERQVLVSVARRLNLDPRALTTVMHLESGGDPSVPAQKSGTPRAGLIQVTVGARMPGLDTADKVWAVREWPITRQLLEIVEPFYARYKGRDPSWSAFALYKRNFLPGVAGKPDDHVIAREGSNEPLIEGLPLTLGQIYAANPGFDSTRRGYYTWADVRKKVAGAYRSAAGSVVTVAGAVSPELPMARVRARRAPGAMLPVPLWLAAPEDMALRPRAA